MLKHLRVRRGFSILIVAALFSACKDEKTLDGGAVFRNNDGCPDSLAQDAFDLLCTFIPGVACTDQVNTCGSYSRQVFTGTELLSESFSVPGKRWNRMGGRGEQMADSLLCSLKELSPEKAGTQTATATLPSLIGDISVTQELGLIEWNREGTAGMPEFKGYRKLRFNLPVFGNIDAITQNIRVTKTVTGYFSNAPLAGGRPVNSKVGLNIETQEKQQGLTLLPPSFEIPTPLGPFAVQPHFGYSTLTSVIDSDSFNGPSYQDLTSFMGFPSWTVRLHDLYGVNAGVAATDNEVDYENYTQRREGWASQIAFGNRDPSVDPAVWSPSGALVLRPDANFRVARSDAESDPTVVVSAGAKMRFPADVHELLPAWVFSLPYVDEIDAYLSIDTQLRAGFSDQFNLGVTEGAYHQMSGEFAFSSFGASTGALWGGVEMAAGFSIIPGLRLLIGLDLPFYGTLEIVDIDVKFPINFPEARANQFLPTVAAISGQTTEPTRVDTLQTYQNSFDSADGVGQYLSQCYQPADDVPAEEPPPPTPPTPGDPSKLIPNHLWQCNICVFVPAIESPENGIHIEERSEYVLPSADGASYQCNRVEKNGCQDWCSWNPDTGELRVVAPASALAEFATGQDNTAHPPTVAGPTIGSRFGSCATP